MHAMDASMLIARAVRSSRPRLYICLTSRASRRHMSARALVHHARAEGRSPACITQGIPVPVTHGPGRRPCPLRAGLSCFTQGLAPASPSLLTPSGRPPRCVLHAGIRSIFSKKNYIRTTVSTATFIRAKPCTFRARKIQKVLHCIHGHDHVYNVNKK